MEIAGRLRFSPFSTQIYRGVAKYGGRSLPAPSSSYKWKISQVSLARRLRRPTTRRLHAGLISITRSVTPYAVVSTESVVLFIANNRNKTSISTRNLFFVDAVCRVFVFRPFILDINNRSISLLLFRDCVCMVE